MNRSSGVALRPDTNWRNRAARGIAGGALAAFIVVGVQICHTIIAARILSPAEFGAFALSLTVSQMAGYFVSAGIAVSVLRSTRPIGEIVGTCLVVALLLGVLTGVLILGCRTPVSLLLQNPTVAELLTYLAFLPLLSAGSVLFVARLRKSGQLNTANLVEAIGTIIGLCLSITLLVSNRGVLSLVAGQIVGQAIILLGSLLIGKQLERMRVTRGALGEIGFFASHVGAQNFAHYVVYNLPLWVAGMVGSAAFVGQYARAWNLVTMPLNQLVLVATKTLQASYPHIEAAGRAVQVSRYVLLLIRFSARTLVPLITAMAISAPTVITVLLGDEWHVAGSIARWLLIFALLNTMYTVSAATAESHRLMARVWAGIVVFGFVLILGLCVFRALMPFEASLVSAVVAAQGAALSVHIYRAARSDPGRLSSAVWRLLTSIVLWVLGLGGLYMLAVALLGATSGLIVVLVVVSVWGLVELSRFRASSRA